MKTVKLSSTFQITIPKTIRDDFGLKPGDQFSITTQGKAITLSPLKKPKGIAHEKN